MTDLLTVQLDPLDYIHLLDLIDSRIRSERGRVNAFRARHDIPNELVAEGKRRQLLELREALTANVKGANDEG